jgi:hypothetical protein
MRRRTAAGPIGVTAFGQAIGKQVVEKVDGRLPVSLHDVLEDFRYRILPTLIG